MVESNIYRVLILNFISALIIAIVVCDIIYSFGLKGGMYFGSLFGLLFLVLYGINNLVDAGEIPNNYYQFILAIVFMILFDVAFLIVIPLIFGPNAFPATENIALNINGTLFNLALSKEFYLVLFGLVVLIVDFVIYIHNKRIYDAE